MSKNQLSVMRALAAGWIIRYRESGPSGGWRWAGESPESTPAHYYMAVQAARNRGWLEKLSTSGYESFWRISEVGRAVLAREVL